MIRRVKIRLAFYLACLLPVAATAQQFRYEAALQRVDTSGFYSIGIQSPLSALLQTTAWDIRIADNEQRWVPHLLRLSKPAIQQEMFTGFPILQNTVNDSGKNVLVIENTTPRGIDRLELFIKNMAVSRTAVLSGSNNRHDWYIIDDRLTIDRSYETAKDEYLQELNFPLVKYRFLEVTVDNMRNSPLLITRAGAYSMNAGRQPATYIYNPATSISQKEEGNTSVIRVTQLASYPFERLSLSISGPKFFARDMEVRLPLARKDNSIVPGNVIGHYKLASSSPPTVELPRIKAEVFFILIKNADNPPLIIDRVHTQQQAMSLVAYLEKDKQYVLRFGDSLAAQPQYDLQSFKDSIALLRSLEYGEITRMKKSDALKNSGAGKRNWIWPVIIVAAVVLSWLTWRLSRDIGKQKN